MQTLRTDDYGSIKAPEDTGPLSGLKGLLGRFTRNSVMAPSFKSEVTAPEGTSINYDNIGSVTGGRMRQLFVEPIKNYATAIDKGMTGQELSIKDLLSIVEVNLDMIAGGGFLAKPRSNTFRMFVAPTTGDIKKAEKMVKAGVPKEQIHKELLMHKKPDGFWRKEIDDSNMDLNRDALKVWESNHYKYQHGKLDEVLPHTELYKQYPELGSSDLRLDELSSDVLGQYSKDNGLQINRNLLQKDKPFPTYKYQEMADNLKRFLKENPEGNEYNSLSSTHAKISSYERMAMHPTPKDSPGVIGTASHELQHGVQGKEGWARGGSPEEMGAMSENLKYELNSLKDRFNHNENLLKKHGNDIFGGELVEKQALLKKEIDALESTINKDPYEAYKNLLGEREARDTKKRVDLSLSERADTLPDFGEGAIIKTDGLSGISQSVQRVDAFTKPNTTQIKATLFKKVTPEEFIPNRERTKRPEFLTPYNKDEMSAWDNYLTDDGVGFSLTDKQDIVGIFNNSGKRGAGQEAVVTAINKGGKTLDNIGGFLDDYYSKFGFKIKEKLKWDDQYAPKGWNYEKYGRPEITLWEYPKGLSREPSDVRNRFKAATGQ